MYYFTYTDSNAINWKLWRTTGGAPTFIQSFSGDGQPLEFDSSYVAGDQFYFVFNRTENGVTTQQLRRVNGSSTVAQSITLPADSQGVFGGIAVGNTLYLNVQIGPTDLKLVKINGTTASVVSDVALVNNNKLAAIGNKVLFMGSVAGGASGLYSSDGTIAGTQLLQAGLFHLIRKAGRSRRIPLLWRFDNQLITKFGAPMVRHPERGCSRSSIDWVPRTLISSRQWATQFTFQLPMRLTVSSCGRSTVIHL